MIKANELRIGNLIVEMGIDYDQSGQPCHCPDMDLQKTVDIAILQDVSAYPDRYGSIKLTPEWLERMGFEWDDNRYDGETAIYRKGCLELHHDEDQPKTGYSIALFDDGNISFAGNDIRYVHQLQNLYFALTGEELAIKAEKHV